MTDADTPQAPPPEDPLPPDVLADRLSEVFTLVGPLYRRAYRKMEEVAPAEGLSVGVRAVLDLLRRHGPMTVPRMGRAQALSRQFVQRMVNDAAARDLTEAVPNPAHRRSSLIRLTEAGAAAAAALHAREHALLRQVEGGLTRTDAEGCVRVLTTMLAFLDDVDVDTGQARSAAPGTASAPTRGDVPLNGH